MSYSSNHIDVWVGEEEQWRFTGVYGFPKESQKWKTGRMLEYLVGRSSLPWLVLGDFNQIMYGFEKVGRRARVDESLVAF
ncbi:hypothetical protein ACS0TY_011794 [Phlomoides rotata]